MVIIAGVVVLGLLVIGVGWWLFLPTLRSLRAGEFEPATKDDASVFQAQQSFTIGGGGS
jgi:hypothetical protein